jgi:hypothetical protein
MIVRHDITADTYNPLPLSTADYRRFKKDFWVASASPARCG